MVFRLKIGLFWAYLSALVVDCQSKQRKLPEKHFPESQTSTANRQSYLKPSLRVKITIINLFSHQSTSTYNVIFSSIQLPLTRTIGPSYYFINPSSTEGKLFNLFYRIMSFTAINKSIRHWGNQIIRLRVFSP